MFPTISSIRGWHSVFLCAAVALFFGLGATPAQAHCGGKHTGNHPHCDSDDHGRSDNTPATMGLDNDGSDAIFSDCTTGTGGTDPDGNQCYVDGEDGATVGLGGQRPARLAFGGRSSKRNRPGRELTLDLSGCAAGDGFGCDRLAEILGLDPTTTDVIVDGFVGQVRPYSTNCPEGAIPDEDEGVCGDINVFTMVRGVPVPMGLWIYMNGTGNLTLEFASRIDPRSAIDPGRGKNICEAAGIDVGPTDDVMVTASDSGEFVNIEGQNNSWEVEADGGSALLFRFGPKEECVAKIIGLSLLMRVERAE